VALFNGEVTSIEALAFLSPTLTRAIMRGEQPSDLRLNRLLRTSIPLSWREQEVAFLGTKPSRERESGR